MFAVAVFEVRTSQASAKQHHDGAGEGLKAAAEGLRRR